MTEQTILQKLVSYIQNSLGNPRGLNIENVTLFLLGEAAGASENTLSNSFLYNIYQGHKLSPNRIAMITDLSDTNWDIDNLRFFNPELNIKPYIFQITEKIQKLFLEYNSDSCSDLSIGTMIHSLVLSHFTGSDEEFVFFNSNDKSFHINYIPWKAKETRLCRLLESHNIVFVTGQPASGKTQLVRYCVHHLGNWNNVFWLDEHPGIPLADRIQYIDFINKNGTPSAEAKNNNNVLPTKSEDILKILKEKTAFSLLVIDIPFIKDEDFSFIKKNLMDVELRIVITTRTTGISKAFASINLDKRPVENLSLIFREYCPQKALSDNVLRNVCQIVSYNPFIMTLIAKCFRKCPDTFNLDKLLDTESWHLDMNPKIHASYQSDNRKSELSVKTLAARILEDYDEEFLKTTGSKLSILAKNEISQPVLEEEIAPEDINKAIDLDLLQYTDHKNKMLQMPAIIADIIWQQYPINYKDYRKRISQNLAYISEGQKLQQTYRSLYEHTVTMIYRFHFQMTEMKTRPSKDDKEAFLEWNQILSEFIVHFIRLGNTCDAQNILYRLYNKKNRQGIKEDLVPSCKLLDRKIFQLHIDFALADSPVKTLNSAIDLLPEIMSQMQASPTQHKLFLPLLEKLYNFIMDAIDSLLLKQVITLVIPGPSIGSRLLNDTLKSLYAFLTTPPRKNIAIFCYYRMIYYYLSCIRKYSEQAISKANEDFHNLTNSEEFSELGSDWNLSFKARLWKFYYDIKLPAESSIKDPFTTEQPGQFVNEYKELYKQFQNSVCSSNTTVLFFYCTAIAYPFLDILHSDIRPDQILAEICDTLIDQKNISDSDIERIQDFIHTMKKFKINTTYSFI